MPHTLTITKKFEMNILSAYPAYPDVSTDIHNMLIFLSICNLPNAYVGAISCSILRT